MCKSIRFLTVILLSICLTEIAVGQPASNEQESPCITVTTSIVGDVEDFALSGDGTATIDWSDGLEQQSVYLQKIPQILESMYFIKDWLVPHAYIKSG